MSSNQTETPQTPPSPKAAFVPEDLTGRPRATIWQRLGSSNTLWVGVILIGLLAAFSIIHPDTFLTLLNIQQLFIQLALLLLLAVGMTFVIITSGIDLSVGSVLIFSSVVGAQLMQAMGGGDATNDGWGIILIGLVATILSGGVWGFINGWLIAYAKVPPLIVTLGSLGAALGAAELLTGGNDVRTVPNLLHNVIGYGTSLVVIPNLVIIVVVITLIFAWVLHTTKFGRYTYAVGSNAEAARRVGIPVKKHLVQVYLLTGVLSGIAGFLSLAYFGTTTLTSHGTDNLNAISGVVLGGTSLFGGVGTLLGTVFGTFIPQVLNSGFVISGIPTFWQPIAVAIVLVAAVWFDQRRRRSQDRG
ncbi:MAG TPA: ABC transporter permease [Pseudonocardiaceae bacterium]|jgi:ribose transport system permease protein|nr:ABC transporter permease [Pseudonocardiaceae bacterium]